MSEELILVDERNRAIGHAEKWTVHQQGLLHRAFSIFLVDETGRLLLQQRSRAKYHSGGLWANSCCGHPRPGERTAQAARRRLGEELGAESTLRFAFRARYRTALPNGLTENEIVYVYFGAAPAVLQPNPDEVAGTAWIDLDDLRRDVRARPGRYAYWLRYYLENHFAAIRAGLRAWLRGDGVRSQAKTSPMPAPFPGSGGGRTATASARRGGRSEGRPGGRIRRA